MSTTSFGAISFLFSYNNVDSYRFLFLDFEILIPTLGLSDPGSYLLAGASLAANDILGEHRWIFNLWPPGMPHIYSLILSAGLPIGLSMFVLSSGVYGLVLTLLFSVVGKLFSRKIAAITLLPGLLNPFAIGSLGPGNVLLSDGLGASFLMLAVLAWLVWVPLLLSGNFDSSSRSYGAIFAVSSVMVLSLRWSMVPIIGLFWLTAAGVAVTNWYLSKRKQKNVSAAGIFEFMKAMAIALTMGLPWTVYVSTILHPPNPLWSVGTDYVWAQRWLKDDDLPGFLMAGNANWACDLDPEKCEALSPLALEGGLSYSVFRGEAVGTIVSNPLGFLATGLSDFFRGFFSAPSTAVGSYSSWELSAISAVLILLCLLMAAWQKNWMVALSVVFLLFPTFFTIAVFHIESRYLLPLHFQAFTICVFSITLALGSRYRPQDTVSK